MKNDKATISKATDKKKTSLSKATATNSKKGGSAITDGNSTVNASQTKKARAGRGLANEGTIVSYEEQR
ncbi:MAG: hypothetical protein WKI04_17370 [Ferruginibacter sp.]